MHTTAQFFSGDGTLLFLLADEGQTVGKVEYVDLGGNRNDLFNGSYIDAVGAFIDAAYGSLGAAVAARIAAAKAAAIVELNNLGEVATAAIEEAGVEIDEMIADITEATSQIHP